MSLPRELLLELLSVHMDGELSHDERERVEQMLANDSAVRDLFASLQQQSLLVRDALQSNAGLNDNKLDQAFADRVFHAAVAASEAEGLSANHPVRLAARGTGVSGFSPASKRNRNLWISGLAVLAASILFVTLYNRPVVDDIRGVGVAVSDVVNDKVADNATSTQQTTEPAGTELPSVQSIASVDPPSPNTQPTTQPAADLELPTAADSARVAADSARLATDSARMATEEPGDMAIAPGMQSLRAIFVYEVHVTSSGRANGVIERALRESNIRISNHRQVDSALTSHLQNGGIIGGTTVSPSAEQAVELMFLDGSGRRLEQAMLKLLAAEGEVSRVGFNMVMDPPVMVAVDSLQSGRPEEIRSIEEDPETVAEPLQPALSTESFTASDRQFAPMGRESVGMLTEMASLSAADQADVPAQVLMVIRYEP
jgi:hypothetical protein